MYGVLDTGSDGGMHAGGVEPLHEQVPVDAPERRSFVERHAVPQPTVERLLDQEVFIEIPEHVGHRLPGELARDANRFELAQRAQPSMTLHMRFRPRARQRGAPVVQGALALQAIDSRVDVVRLELAPRESRPHLRFRQFAPRQHAQTGDVRVSHLRI